MTMGIAFAVTRLKKQQIFCIAPVRVNVTGRIDLIGFDKTGTLTESGLRVFGALPTAPENDLGFGELISVDYFDDLLPRPLLYLFASCHSLSLMNDEVNGDPLDISMFSVTRWSMEPLPKAIMGEAVHYLSVSSPRV
eukprot:TRINITY_DN16336_c0_g1_i1.p1 TRINITY_DN16336_c0_g1~~TRINITY_DN16336_c0_g1_i1.p1  ORF type:complete len:137 (+),score=12.39 TRINITY_DN16336_c0_g1_i1:101-511(+)